MTSREERLRPEVHARAHRSIDQFRAVVERFAANPEVKAAYDQAPTALTRGRSFAEMAMDDALEAFEFIMQDVPATEVPLDYYRQIMIHRNNGRDISAAEAEQHLHNRIEARRSQTIARVRALPDFLTATLDKVNPSITNVLIQNWATTLNNMQALPYSEAALQAQRGAQTLSQAFNVAMQKRAAEEQANAEMLAKLKSLGNDKPTAPAGGTSIPVRVEQPKNTGLPPRLQKLLNAFGEDITSQAQQGKLTPVIGRDEDVNRTLAALLRDRAPFALTTGAEGVGKSAVTKALAQRIADGNVPDELKDARVIRLKLRDMKAGSGMSQGAHAKMGEPRMLEQFSDWLNTILNETAEYNAKGGPQIILNIDELGEMGGRIPNMFQAKDILGAAMAEGKSLRLIGEITDIKRKGVEEGAPGLLEAFTEVKLKPLSKEQTIEALRINGFEKTDGGLLTRAIEWTNQFINSGEQPGKALDVLVSAQGHAKIAGQELNEDHIIRVLSDITGRPAHMFGKSKSEQMKDLERELPNRVLGQPVIHDMLKIIKAGNSSLQDPNKPIASILAVGPTGNGKTETAKAIADLLGIPLVTIDMSNFQDQHAKAKLLGAPPGYVGFDKKAALEDVADNPYCVLLLDEIDKAHPEAHNIFLSVLDEGRQQLMNGKTVRFNNTIIIMTSNFGARAAQEAKDKQGIGFHSEKGGEDAAKVEYKKAIDAKMPPEYQNRLDLIAYYDSLSQDVMKKIALQKIAKVSKALRESDNLDLQLSPQAIEELSARGVGYSPEYGARPLDRAIKNLVKVPLLDWLEQNHTDKSKLLTVFVKSVKDKFDAEIRTTKAPRGPGAPAPA